MSEVKLTYNSQDYTIFCTGVRVAWNNNNVSKPNANGTTAVNVQTQSFENPIYTLQGVHLTNEALESSDTITYNDLLTLAKVRYDGTSSTAIELTFTFSNSGTTETLIGSDGSSPIKVVVDSFNFPFIADTEYDDGTNEYYIPIGTITLRETA